ncbi:MAG: cupin domain-containing protein [Alphaproteobacteria bacterium]
MNIADVSLSEVGNGNQFVVNWGRVGRTLGLKKLGCAVHVVPPGKKAFPFHRHHVLDELCYIISGQGEYRFGDQVYPLKPGDFVGAPAGTEAHQIINTGTEDLHYFCVSTTGEADVVDYPDSGKIAVAAGVKDGNMKTATYTAIGRIQPVHYLDGEE